MLPRRVNDQNTTDWQCGRAVGMSPKFGGGQVKPPVVRGQVRGDRPSDPVWPVIGFQGLWPSGSRIGRRTPGWCANGHRFGDLRAEHDDCQRTPHESPNERTSPDAGPSRTARPIPLRPNAEGPVSHPWGARQDSFLAGFAWLVSCSKTLPSLNQSTIGCEKVKSVDRFKCLKSLGKNPARLNRLGADRFPDRFPDRFNSPMRTRNFDPVHRPARPCRRRSICGWPCVAPANLSCTHILDSTGLRFLVG